VGVEPAGAPKLKRSLSGPPGAVERTASIADGLITLGVGELPFAQLAAHRDAWRRGVVDDDALARGGTFLWQHCHLAVDRRAPDTGGALRSIVPRCSW